MLIPQELQLSLNITLLINNIQKHERPFLIAF